jgi:hypothetical protein
MTTVLCLLLAYLQPFGMPVIGQCGLVVVVGATLGCIVGAVCRRTANVVFWSVIGVILGYLAVLNAYVDAWTDTYAWPLVGAIAAAAAANVRPGKPFVRAATAAMTAAGLTAAYLVSTWSLELSFSAELVCAVLGGSILGLATEVTDELEAIFHLPRSAMAVGLIGVALAGHRIATSYITGW